VSDCEIIIEDGKEAVITPDGFKYSLGLVPDLDPPRLTTLGRLLGALPSRAELIDFSESQEYQKNVGGMSHFDSSWTKNQNGWGKCASSAATYAVEKARYRGGQPRVELSDDYLYSLCNEGRDAGGTLGDNLRAITERGIATRKTVKEGQIYRKMYDTSKADKEALRFRAHEGFATPSEQEVVTALIVGCPVVIAIHVGRNWRQFDKDGVLAGDRGPGNHSEHLDHVRYNRTKGRFEFREHSSHGKSQGEGGFFWVTWEQHLSTVHPSHTFYAVPNAIQDPFGLSPFGDGNGEEENKPEPVASVRLIVVSSEFCSWCKRWNEKDRPVLEKANVSIVAGDVPGSGVPRFRLEVGTKSVDKVGYWDADAILREIASMKMDIAYQS
jgi:hypothetical protein